MSLLDDWLAYVERPDLFDMDHFGGLMLELDSPSLLHRAFNPLPNGSAVADRISAFRELADFNGTYLLPPLRDGDLSVASQLAERYRDGVADRLSELADPEAGFVRNSQIEAIDCGEYKLLKKTGELRLLNATMTLEDDEGNASDPFPDWKYGLREAVYMMTTFPEITRYLLWPMFKYSIDDAPAAELWLMGHRLDFCENRTLLIIGGAG